MFTPTHLIIPACGAPELAQIMGTSVKTVMADGTREHPYIWEYKYGVLYFFGKEYKQAVLLPLLK